MELDFNGIRSPPNFIKIVLRHNFVSRYFCIAVFSIIGQTLSPHFPLFFFLSSIFSNIQVRVFGICNH
ncbi:hypothetical protein L6452_37791 [Arctium lappa]|uniref:Uncharacterized protein n=1 Tax=Arctium lappa TaxID=4217 RepID=A0ACB8Y4L6_ARCLA|nr:hypothetical protein L6452_37791 [Arctium lappa]